MTKNEFNELFNQMCYGHEAEISYNGKQYFFEWNKMTLIVYDTTDEHSSIVAEICAKDVISTVTKFFDTPIFDNNRLNVIYGDIEIVDIE